METAERPLADGRILVVYPLLHGMGRLGIGPADRPVFDDEW